MTEAQEFHRNLDDYNDLIKEVERSFDIHLDKSDLKNIQTFGELCDAVSEKISLNNIGEKNHQQAFLKLRTAIASVKKVDKQSLLPETKLSDLFPRKGRIKAIRELEFELGFSLRVLRPFLLIELLLMLSFLASIVFLFIHFGYGMEALAVTIVLNTIAFRTGKEFSRETIDELAKKITKDNERKKKKSSTTFTNAQVEERLREIFQDGYLLEGESVSRKMRIP